MKSDVKPNSKKEKMNILGEKGTLRRFYHLDSFSLKIESGFSLHK